MVLVLQLFLDHQFDYVITSGDKQFVLVIENQPRGWTVRLEDGEVTTVTVEHLDAFEITNVNATFAVNRNRRRRPKLTWLVAGIAKTR